jgi:hypothetical protein
VVGFDYVAQAGIKFLGSSFCSASRVAGTTGIKHYTCPKKILKQLL